MNRIQQRLPRWLLLLLLPPAIFLALYVRTVDYSFVWMDTLEIQEGALLLPTGALLSAFTRPLHPASGQGQVNPYYRPLQLLLVNAVYRIAGPQPRYFHITSLFMGALTASLFAGFAWLLLRRTGPALLAAGIFVAHPVGIEPYVWISAISEAMSMLFILGSLMAAYLYIQVADERRSRLFIALSVFALALALLSKEKAIVVPVLLLALLISLVAQARRSSDAAREELVRRRGGMLLRAQLITVIVYLFFLRPLAIGGGSGSAPLMGGDVVTHLLTALATWPASIGWLFAPLHSTTSDVVELVTSFSDPGAWAGLIVALGSVVAWVWFLRRGWVIAAFGLAWIWIAFGLTSNIIPMLHPRSERSLFLSVLGMALLVGELLPVLLTVLQPKLRKVLAFVLAVTMVGGLAQRNYARVPDWSSNLSLFDTDVKQDPYFREGRVYLALTLFQQWRYPEADEHLQKLIAYLEHYPGRTSYINASDVYQLACANDLAQGKRREAMVLIESLAATNPGLANDPNVRLCLGHAYEESGNHREAVRIFLSVAESLPGGADAETSIYLARNYLLMKDYIEARRWLTHARTSGPVPVNIEESIRRLEAKMPAHD